MEMKKIRELATLLGEFEIEELNLQEGESNVTLRRPRPEPIAQTVPAPIQVGAQTQAIDASATATEPDLPFEDTGTITVTSPMVGMFYAASSPSEPPFATVGQEVKAGDLLCIIEAMKLMNEIVAEQDGVITRCYHGNEQPVEFGQALFQMRCE